MAATPSPPPDSRRATRCPSSGAPTSSTSAPAATAASPRSLPLSPTEPVASGTSRFGSRTTRVSAANRTRRPSKRKALEAGPFSSGCPDLNWGPLRPERSALPGCATPRDRNRVASPEESLAMARRDEIIAYANELLDLAAFKDYRPQGLQVAGAEEVTRVVCSVSASLELFRAGRRRRSAARDRPSRPALGQRAARDRRPCAAAAPGPVRGGHQPRRLPPRARRPSRDRQQRAARAGARRRGRRAVPRAGPRRQRVDHARRVPRPGARADRPRAARLRRRPGATSGASRSSPAAGSATCRRRPPRATTSSSPESRPSRASISPRSSGSTSSPPGTTRPRSSASRR